MVVALAGGAHLNSISKPPSSLPTHWFCPGTWKATSFASGCWPAGCQGAHNLCGSGSASGMVRAVLPTRVGDSVPLEQFVGVASKPWSAVKQLYR